MPEELERLKRCTMPPALKPNTGQPPSADRPP
jgi:hypothetical protein